MEEDWQSAAFSSRHMHNRVHQNKHSRRSRPFDVYHTFGSYTCKCAVWQKQHASQDTEQEVTLELYRLSPKGEGIIGEISFPGVLKATVILAASRASLDRTVREVEGEVEPEASVEDEGSDNRIQPDEEGAARFHTFEKNSFRAPKFFFHWNGIVEESDAAASDRGYVVFSGNECRKFKGTITCSAKGWKDAAISGHKIVSRKASDMPVNWNGSACDF